MFKHFKVTNAIQVLLMLIGWVYAGLIQDPTYALMWGLVWLTSGSLSLVESVVQRRIRNYVEMFLTLAMACFPYITPFLEDPNFKGVQFWYASISIPLGEGFFFDFLVYRGAFAFMIFVQIGQMVWDFIANRNSDAPDADEEEGEGGDVEEEASKTLKFCPKCGDKVLPSWDYCMKCGHKSHEGDEEEAEEAPKSKGGRR